MVGGLGGGRALGARRPDSMEDGGLSPDRTRQPVGWWYRQMFHMKH